jgi:RNA polymerase sigma factor, sigma-70 family
MTVAWGVRSLSGAGPRAHAADESGQNTDPSLLAEIAEGNADALRCLYRRHGAALFTYVLSLVGDRGLAEEAVQDTLMAVWRGAGRFRSGSSVRTWLFSIARRRAISAVQRRGIPSADDTSDVLDAVEDTTASPERQVLARAELADAASAIRSLSPRHREVLLLALVEGMSAPQISAVVGIPAGTVRSRLRLARRALAEALRTDDASRS